MFWFPHPLNTAYAITNPISSALYGVPDSLFLPYIYVFKILYRYFSSLFGIKMNASFYFFTAIRLNIAGVRTIFNHYHLQGYCSICPSLENLVHTFKCGFILICCFIWQHDFISNPIILIDSSWTFANDIFFYFIFLALTHKFPICYVYDCENHVSAKHQLD